jgi:acyl carrier protein
MTDDAILARVHAVVAGIAGASRTREDAGPDTPLGASGFWLDSLDLVEVVVACEQEFGVTFDGETDVTPESLASIRSLAALIRSKGGR